MQPKHAWNKVLKLSGNIEEDFQNVMAFLEKKDIMNAKYLRNTLDLPRNTSIKNIRILEYRAMVDGEEIQAFFEKYLDTGETFLKNSWVVTK